MKLTRILYSIKKIFRHGAFLLIPGLVLPWVSMAQESGSSPPALKANNGQPSPVIEKTKGRISEDDFRIEKIPVEGGAEIVTIFVKTHRTVETKDYVEEVPLVSVLRDTLGDDLVENDRLRHVWVLTYTKPTFAQKFAAAIPFLYSRTTNKEEAGSASPPAVIDLNPSQNEIWNKIFWRVFKNLILGDLGTPAKAAAVQYKTNVENYRKSAIARALAVIALYEAVEGKKILSDTEMRDIQARMLLSDKMLGSLVQDENLERVYQKNIEKVTDLRGHNWELLRQYSEAQGLYFEPLEMPDGSATHALIWTSETDLENNKNKVFQSRFLNIKSPWKDERLRNWDGYSEIRWFDESNYRVEPGTPGATPRKMIPLALYGLDYPKIPTLLIDFRDIQNPKKREVSKRILDDLTKNIFSPASSVGLPYTVGRYFYNFVTARRGIDFNQASRVNSYSQLKLLLSLNESLDPGFRAELSARTELVSLNPLENDLEAESKIARQQYDNLIAFAMRPAGLPKQLENERREEMTRLKHGDKKIALFNIGHLLSFGLYTHRETPTPDLRGALDIRRQLEYHERYLREAARVSVNPAVDGDLNAIRRSLDFIAEYGDSAQAKTAEAIAKIFSLTDDEQTRAVCLRGLNQIKNPGAKKKLLAIYENQKIDVRWRNISAGYLHLETKNEPTEHGSDNEKSALKDKGQ